MQKQNRNQDVLKEYGRGNVNSMDDFAYTQDGPSIQDSICIDDIKEMENQKESMDKLENVLSHISKLDTEEYLIMRTVLLFYEPLNEEEKSRIAEMTGRSRNDMEREIHQITDRLIESNMKRIKEENQQAVQVHKIHKLEAKLTVLRQNPFSDQAEIHDIEKEIKKKSESLEKRRIKKTKERMIRPTNREIAQLTGISEDQATIISARLLNIRNTLIQQIQNGQRNEPESDFY